MRTYYPWWRMGETVFENYGETKRALRQIEANAAHRQRSLDGMPHGSGISDPTANGGLYLCSPRVEMMYREVKAVEKTYDLLASAYRGADKVHLMRLIFSDRRNNMAVVAANLGIDYSTARNWKKEAMLILAHQIGWM